MSGVFYLSVIHSLGFFICYTIDILRVQKHKTHFFYVLDSGKTQVFDQSEHTEVSYLYSSIKLVNGSCNRTFFVILVDCLITQSDTIVRMLKFLPYKFIFLSLVTDLSHQHRHF